MTYTRIVLEDGKVLRQFNTLATPTDLSYMGLLYARDVCKTLFGLEANCLLVGTAIPERVIAQVLALCPKDWQPIEVRKLPELPDVWLFGNLSNMDSFVGSREC